MSFEKAYIYILICPVENTVFYVGCTENPHRRKINHSGKKIRAQSLLGDKLRKLIAINQKPIFKIISEVPVVDKLNEERKQIINFLNQGSVLCNVYDPRVIDAKRFAAEKRRNEKYENWSNPPNLMPKTGPVETPAQTKRRVRDAKITKLFIKYMEPGVIRSAALQAISKELNVPISTVNRVTQHLNR